MKIALAQQNYHVGNFEANTAKIIAALQEAKKQKVELVVFSELSICGYPPRDFLEFKDFIDQCYAAVDAIKVHCDTIAAIVGAPAINPGKAGKKLFNAAWFLYEGKVQSTAYKTLLPTYDVFDEYRYFEPADQWQVIGFKGHKIALTICEDIWNLGDHPLYRICPMDKLMAQHPDLLINISASPFDYDHDDDRKEVIRANVLKYQLPIFYCNAVGAQTDLIFDGGSLVMDAKGNLVKELNYFEEDFAILDLSDVPSIASSNSAAPKKKLDQEMRVSRLQDPGQILSYLTAEKNIAEIHQALIVGIRDYFQKMGFTKALIGVSGGIDSAVALVLACEALGKEQVRGVLMPSQYSSAASVTDAQELCRNLGNPQDLLPIQAIYDSFLTTLKPLFGDLPFGIAEENLQSRTRGNLLMALANKFGCILLNTSNKSELATGYGTLYGDMAGGISVLGDVYKTQVYALANYLNARQKRIPDAILTKAPSAELRPGQKDADSLPDYAVLDKILYQYIERRLSPSDILASGAEQSLVRRILKLVNENEYKRNQFCPILRVSAKAFGMGRRVPIVGKYLS